MRVFPKAWHGRITLGWTSPPGTTATPWTASSTPSGWEADQLATALGAPVILMLCMHDVELPRGKVVHRWLPGANPGRLVATLRTLAAHLNRAWSRASFGMRRGVPGTSSPGAPCCAQGYCSRPPSGWNSPPQIPHRIGPRSACLGEMRMDRSG
jgi:hypothetical protein